MIRKTKNTPFIKRSLKIMKHPQIPKTASPGDISKYIRNLPRLGKTKATNKGGNIE
jgi:hypothetical protein